MQLDNILMNCDKQKQLKYQKTLDFLNSDENKLSFSFDNIPFYMGTPLGRQKQGSYTIMRSSAARIYTREPELIQDNLRLVIDIPKFYLKENKLEESKFVKFDVHSYSWNIIKQDIKTFAETNSIPLHIVLKYLKVREMIECRSIFKWIIENEDFEFFEYILNKALSCTNPTLHQLNSIEDLLRFHIPIDRVKTLAMINVWLDFGFKITINSPLLFELYDAIECKQNNCLVYLKMWIEDLHVPLEYMYSDEYYRLLTSTSTHFKSGNFRNMCYEFSKQAFNYFYSIGLSYVIPCKDKNYNDYVFNGTTMCELKKMFISQNRKWKNLLHTISENLLITLPNDLVNICKYYIFSHYQLTGNIGQNL